MSDRSPEADTAGPDAPVAHVGFVGVGRMGLPMAGHVAAAGFSVSAFDVDETARQRAESAGIGLAASPAEVAAGADLVLVVVPTDEDVLSVCRGPEGLIEAGRPGTLIAVCSSVRPETVGGVHGEAGPRGLGVLDLPLTKGIRAAEAGTMTLLAGGTARDLERARPVLDCFSSAVHHVGPVGSAQVAKTVNNLFLWAHLAAAAEALEFGARHGLEVERLRAALLDCSAESWVLRELANIQPVWPAKDMRNALIMADEIGFAMPLAEGVAERIGDLDRAALDRLLALGAPAERNDGKKKSEPERGAP